MKQFNEQGRPISCSISGWIGTGVIGSTLMVINPAAAANTLSAWQFDPVTQQFTVTLPRGVTPQVVAPATPGQVVLHIPQTQLGNVEAEQLYEGAVHRVRVTQADNNTLEVVLELAPGRVLAPNQAQLTALESGPQTRWVLTPLIAAANPTASAPGGTTPAPDGAAMVVELPVIPAAESGFTFPEAGQGRLSTTAANLMLPSDVDSLDNLPETLPIDPFNIGLAGGEQVTVPGLDELDAVVGPVVTVPQETVTSPESLTDDARMTADMAEVAALPSNPEVDPEAILPITVAPPDAEATAPVNSNQPGTETVAVVPDLAADPPVPDAAETEAIDLIVVPADPSPEAGLPDVPGVAAEPVPEPPIPDASTVILAEQPVSTPEAAAPSVPQDETWIQPITEAPPQGAGAVVAGTAPLATTETTDVLSVPALPSTPSTATVTPPTVSTPNELIVATAEPINFGQPLPGSNGKAVNHAPAADTDSPHHRPIPPDILIAAGTVLELRYPGPEPLVLEAGTDLKEVLLLETEIRDPITQGVLAPRGSQLLGQFQPNGTNQQWVSEMIIVPAGQRVPLASTSEYLVGTPQVNGGRLAAGAGAGALALALLTSFSGIGLIGGAIVGATTMVGTSPQQVVIEPNQIIAVQVTENVPRLMPIAAGPDLSREWGVE